MVCPKCGTITQAHYCPNCGMKLDETASDRLKNQKVRRLILLAFSFAFLAFCLFMVDRIWAEEDAKQLEQEVANGECWVSESGKRYYDGRNSENYITYEQFEKCEDGMSYKKLRKVLGYKGQIVSSGEYDPSIFSVFNASGPGTEVYRYFGKQEYAIATFVFKDNKLVGKTQTGLK